MVTFLRRTVLCCIVPEQICALWSSSWADLCFVIQFQSRTMLCGTVSGQISPLWYSFRADLCSVVQFPSRRAELCALMIQSLCNRGAALITLQEMSVPQVETRTGAFRTNSWPLYRGPWSETIGGGWGESSIRNMRSSLHCWCYIRHIAVCKLMVVPT
jgi:hypothetical protein